MDDTSVKWSIMKSFFVFHLILMKLGKVVVHMKNKKVFIIDRLTEVSSIKVLLSGTTGR